MTRLTYRLAIIVALSYTTPAAAASFAARFDAIVETANHSHVIVRVPSAQYDERYSPGMFVAPRRENESA